MEQRQKETPGETTKKEPIINSHVTHPKPPNKTAKTQPKQTQMGKQVSKVNTDRTQHDKELHELKNQ